MKYGYPKPQDVGVKIPVYLEPERFCAGFEHALKGGQLHSDVKNLRLSFREGYRAAKIYLKGLRRRQGLVEFPVRGRIKLRVH